LPAVPYLLIFGSSEAIIIAWTKSNTCCI